MDTNVLPDETNDLHIELSKSADRLDRQEARTELNVGYGSTVGGMAITNNYHALVTEAVIEKLSGPRLKASSSEFKLERLLRQLDPAVLALCVLQSGLHCAGRRGRNTHRDAVLLIGLSLNTELWAHKLLQTDRKLALKVSKQAKERFGSVELRVSTATKAAEAEGFHMAEWSPVLRAHAGNWGISILLKAMPLVFDLQEPKGFKGEPLWTITEFGMDMAKEAVAEAVCKSPVYQPRTERPKDWDRFVMRVAEDDRTLDRARLLRTGHKDIMSAAAYALRSGTMSPAISGLNALQSVPFKINTWIMDVIIKCYNKGVTVDGLPSWASLPVPKKLPMDAFKALPVEARRLHSSTRKGRLKANRGNDADTIAFTEDMEVASRLAVADQFYTPMNMDWRGRVYALTHFNFHREDRVRALFLFANGEPLGEEGLYWLKVHVANCGDFDKVSKRPIEGRVKWVDDNIATLADYVRRPLYRTDWTKADNPFLFLAACRELCTALAGDTRHHICHLPVSWDGSCSGLQHLSAMTRAPEGRHVNLTDNAEPADVYQLVADLAKARIEADLNNDEVFGRDPDKDQPDRKTSAPLKQLARIALDYGVDRGLVKRNVMTFAYSSKEFGMSEQHYEDTMVPLEMKLLKGEVENHPFGETEDEWRLASRYLAKRVLAAIKDVVRLPAEAMEFMQKLAKALAHEGKPLRWTSPAGVPCINRYHESTTERLTLWCHNKGISQRTRVMLATGHEKPIAKDKAAAGIAPNFVHSHDAAHLLLTVAAAAAEGITDIATVHDSFGCLPSRAARFNAIIREQFLKMYTDHDVLAELLESARADLTPANHDKLPALPEKGALDLTEILNARYAFA
jgi:DNA-directed RNA polymerase, mitochondrial